MDTMTAWPFGIVTPEVFERAFGLLAGLYEGE
jgi:hypothetical protein